MDVAGIKAQRAAIKAHRAATQEPLGSREADTRERSPSSSSSEDSPSVPAPRCPLCSGRLPRQPSDLLNRLVKESKGLPRWKWPAPTPEVCNQHRLELKFPAEKVAELGYPAEIDFRDVLRRLQDGRVKERVDAIIASPTDAKSHFWEQWNKAGKRVMQNTGMLNYLEKIGAG